MTENNKHWPEDTDYCYEESIYRTCPGCKETMIIDRDTKPGLHDDGVGCLYCGFTFRCIMRAGYLTKEDLEEMRRKERWDGHDLYDPQRRIEHSRDWGTWKYWE